MGLKRVEPFAERRGTPLNFNFIELLAIDPGEHTGWAVYGSLSVYGPLSRLLACGLGMPPVEAAARVVIELPQVYPQHPVPPNDLITLAFLAGRYAGKTKQDAEVSTVFPHQWKGNLPKDVCAARVRMKLTPEERDVADAAFKEGRIPAAQRHNVMDAVGIGLSALGRVF